MKNCRFLLCSFLAMFASLAHAQEKRAALSADQKAFLERYEAVRAGLAADDLGVAKKASAAIAAAPGVGSDAAKKISGAVSIEAAREAFKALSQQAVSVAEGQPGYYHAHCPMVPKQEGDWVQTSKKISNPYFGKAMATCGSIEQ
ncbi:MAG: hypothetical protein ABIZ81_05080 [Opitutaceae bacterium]